MAALVDEDDDEFSETDLAPMWGLPIMAISASSSTMKRREHDFEHHNKFMAIFDNDSSDDEDDASKMLNALQQLS